MGRGVRTTTSSGYPTARGIWQLWQAEGCPVTLRTVRNYLLAGIVASEPDPDRPGRRQTAVASAHLAALAVHPGSAQAHVHAVVLGYARAVKDAKSCTVFALDAPTACSSAVAR